MFETVQFFVHLHLKFAKNAIMTPKKFSLKNINLNRLKQMPLKKPIAKNYASLIIFVFSHFSMVFAFNFF
jgi:hypothetical protein